MRHPTAQLFLLNRNTPGTKAWSDEVHTHRSQKMLTLIFLTLLMVLYPMLSSIQTVLSVCGLGSMIEKCPFKAEGKRKVERPDESDA